MKCFRIYYLKSILNMVSLEWLDGKLQQTTTDSANFVERFLLS